MREATLILMLAALTALTACDDRRESAPPALDGTLETGLRTPRAKPRFCGVASFYHPSLQGEPTANGETYDETALTAAHRALPFGARLEVVRRDTGDKVTIRINDRGPFIEGRVLDLSRAAAQRLDINDENGLAEICATRLKYETADR